MIDAAFDFDRPPGLEATAPPEARGLRRNDVRLLVTDDHGSSHHPFTALPDLLSPGDLLVVNGSATLPASLPVRHPGGELLLNVSTQYADRIWLAEPRFGVGAPGPVPLDPRTSLTAGPASFRPIEPYPGIDRLWFFRSDGSVSAAMASVGRPIRYGYVDAAYPLTMYQTIFARVPGSAEMPSAGRPFTHRELGALRRRGIRTAEILLHTGVSSLESEVGRTDLPPVYPEPFDVPAKTAELLNATRGSGHRVVAVGTTVLRALETAWDGCRVAPSRGFTRLVLGPGRAIHSVDGLVTGFHDPRTSHLALLFGFAGRSRVRAAYAEAVRARYLWHEFGDSHLLWRPGAAQ